MLKVSEITNPFSPAINIEAGLEKAAFLFEKTGFRVLPVVENGLFCGILEREKMAHLPRFSGQKVTAFFTRNTVFLSLDDPADAAVDLLAAKVLDIIPVVNEHGSLVGTITAEDIPSAKFVGLFVR